MLQWPLAVWVVLWQQSENRESSTTFTSKHINDAGEFTSVQIEYARANFSTLINILYENVCLPLFNVFRDFNSYFAADTLWLIELQQWWNITVLLICKTLWLTFHLCLFFCLYLRMILCEAACLFSGLPLSHSYSYITFTPGSCSAQPQSQVPRSMAPHNGNAGETSAAYSFPIQIYCNCPKIDPAIPPFASVTFL